MYLLGWIFIIGYVANIIQIFMSFSSSITVELLLKIIGVVAFPLGILMGWVGFF